VGQRREDRGRDKIYALHAPEVECIGKGKARTRFEFGCKVSIATTNRTTPGGQFVIGAQRWLGFSLQRFGADNWLPCRLIRTFCRCRGVTQGGRSPTEVRSRHRRPPHAAILCGMWSR
jgi:hypothetical protein